MFTGQQFIGNAAQGVDIIPGVGLFTFQHFQAGIGRRKGAQLTRVEQGFFRFTGDRILDRPGDAEVQGLYSAVVTQECVARFEVGMYQAPFVGIGKCRCKLPRDFKGLREGQAALFANYLLYVGIQRLTFHKLHGDVDRRPWSANAVEIVDRGDIGVSQLLLAA